MASRITLLMAVAAAALAIVPTAFGEGRLAGSLEPDAVAYFYANERATLASSQGSTALASSQQQSGVAYFYANERATLVSNQGSAVVSRPDSHETAQPFSYIDAAERADRISSAPARDVVLLSGDDHTTFQPVDSSTPVASTGRDIDWSQVGIAFGIGIALALGLILALRATRQRPLAH
jgi:hypothetical protein